MAYATYEKLIVEIEAAGALWVQAEAVSKRYQELKKVKLAQLKKEIEKENPGVKYTHAALETEALAHPDYREFLDDMTNFWKEAETQFLHYEALKNKFDAARSEMAFERTKLERGI